ncbi:MAG: hypothetical protein HYT98_04915 [Candidatus Sungbacteria bacterium]|nr:hypothetical protein [Candidatus Sungbacteria bacterium]
MIHEYKGNFDLVLEDGRRFGFFPEVVTENSVSGEPITGCDWRRKIEVLPVKAKVLFYHWDWQDRPEFEPIQRAIDAVFDGQHAPRITDNIPTADWDQCTVAVTSVPISAEGIGRMFLKYLDDDAGMYWWEKKTPPCPMEVDV